jgi:hypothetical protein
MKSPKRFALLPDIRRMMQFVEMFPEEEIVATLSRQLSWSRFRKLPPNE